MPTNNDPDINDDVPDIVGCLSEALMHANEIKAVIVLSVTKDNSIDMAYSATWVERLGLCKYLENAMNNEAHELIDKFGDG